VPPLEEKNEHENENGERGRLYSDKKPVRMAIRHAPKGPKCDKSAGTFAGTLKIEKM